MKGMLGKKLGMTAMFTPDGKYVPVTVLEIGPCVVTQIKTVSTDGYDALQIGIGTKKESAVNKPLKGHYKKSGNRFFSRSCEFQTENPKEYKIGQNITLDIFKVGEIVNITGTTKGRGFSGVIKRHGFHGGKKTHGSHSHRIPGSIGCSAWPAKVVKGKKMPGRYGNATQTVKNLEIMDIRPEDNVMLIKGPVPGCNSGFIKIKKKKF
jgi:large subunit ribosomal protein L3